jgi:hypothetical protein
MANLVPDFFGELTGWRKFAVRDRGRLLVSAMHPIPWRSADPGEAVCIADHELVSHVCPDLRCTCGFYAYKRHDDGVQHGQGVVLAQVKLWGRVVEHVHGYRAERMRIAALFVKSGTASVRALTDRYQVPVTEGEESWILENPSASSPSNPYPNQFQNPQWYQNPTYYPVNPAFLNPYGPVSNSSQASLLAQQQMQVLSQQVTLMQQAIANQTQTPSLPFVIVKTDEPQPVPAKTNRDHVDRFLKLLKLIG